MKKKTGVLLLVTGMVLMMLGGCRREPTAADIMRKTVENTGKAESFSGNMLMEAGIGIEESGLSLGFDMTIDMDIDAVKESGACHMKGSVKADLADLAMEMELYSIPEEDGSGITAYAKLGDEWTKVKNDEDEGNDIAALMNLENYLEKGTKLKLEEETEEKDGRELYVITTSADSNISKGVGAVMDGMFGNGGEDLDFGDAQLDVTFRVYRDEMMPESVSLVLSGQDGEELEIPNEEGSEITFRDLRLVLEFEEFNHLDEIKVPAEALEAQSDAMDIMGDLEKDDDTVAAENAVEPELEKDSDGNYILTDWDGESEVFIAPREGMMLDQYSEDTYLCFYKDGDGAYSATYTLETLYDKEFYTESKKEEKESYESREEYSDIEYQEEREFEADGRKVTYVTLTYTYDETLYKKDVYAWTFIDDEHMLICEIGEYPEEKGEYAVDEAVIKKLFEGIKS